VVGTVLTLRHWKPNLLPLGSCTSPPDRLVSCWPPTNHAGLELVSKRHFAADKISLRLGCRLFTIADRLETAQTQWLHLQEAAARKRLVNLAMLTRRCALESANENVETFSRFTAMCLDLLAWIKVSNL
jgi:hypothetical protein